jgi:prephenate dehydratase
MTITVSYQGEPGAYSQKATLQFLGDDIESIGLESFEEVFKSVTSGAADYAMVPIENSLGGSIHANYDLFLRYDLHIIGEMHFRVEHCLLTLPGTKREDIKYVMSHPQALAQCAAYLRDWAGAEPKVGTDTAGSAKIIQDQGLKDHAAIASDLAGKHYGMTVMERNIEDDDNNYTRFLLLSRTPSIQRIGESVVQTDAKTSVVFALHENEPGALFKALSAFAVRDIDLAKIESRPLRPDLLLNCCRQQPGSESNPPSPPKPSISAYRYFFYLDALASMDDVKLKNALNHLRCLQSPCPPLLPPPPASFLPPLRTIQRNLHTSYASHTSHTSFA